MLLVIAAAMGGGCGRSEPETPVAGSPVSGEVCDCELSSWVVAGRGRHLYVTIDCPEGYDELDGVVEFTSESLRRDYVERRDPAGMLVAPRVARMTRGVRLRPLVDDPAERVEARWSITLEQARAIEEDRVWGDPYVLIGANSNSAMAASLRSAGLSLPARVRDGGGILGEFPGIDVPLGATVEVGRPE
jgi:hypothetical protein